MTAQEIITLYESLVDDSMDQDAALALLNAKLTEIESERDWTFLTGVQTASGTSFALPADYRKTLSLSVGSTFYAMVPFRQAGLYQQASTAAGTARHTYKKKTTPLALADSPVWPEEYHPLLAFALAADFSAVDQEERGRSWDDRWSAKETALKRAMVGYDVGLQNQGAENSFTPSATCPFYVDPTTSTVVLLNGGAVGSSIELGIF